MAYRVNVVYTKICSIEYGYGQNETKWRYLADDIFVNENVQTSSIKMSREFVPYVPIYDNAALV